MTVTLSPHAVANQGSHNLLGFKDKVQAWVPETAIKTCGRIPAYISAACAADLR